LGQTLGANDVNIANFTLGRSTDKSQAIALLYIDEPVTDTALKALDDTGLFQKVKTLKFEV
jgi:D-3-phosphoglycerate dehydrogenase